MSKMVYEEVPGNGKKPSGKAKREALRREILEYLLMILSVIAVVLILDTFVIINARIPSSSMENTIMIGDQIIGNRLAYRKDEPERFDIVVFRYPDNRKQLFIKRVIGLPGETVEIVEGKVYINGSAEPLDDSFCAETPYGSFGPYEVPEGCFFMMGDNRNNSNDSRYWVNRFVPSSDILGKAWFRYWPVTRFGGLT